MQTAVHQLLPPPGDTRKIGLNILFFHSHPRDPEEHRYPRGLVEYSKPRDPDKWKSAWSQRSHPDVFWPEKWLPADLGNDVRVLFALYDSQSRVADIVDDLFKVLVIRDEWDLCKDDQPLVLVGRDFGTLVLDNLFLKATEEVSTSPTAAKAFVRNVRGVTLYGDEDKSYRIAEFFGTRLENIERVVRTFNVNFCHGVSMTQGSMLFNPAFSGKNLPRELWGRDACQWIRENICESPKWDPEVRWKPESKQSRSYSLLLESCRRATIRFSYRGITSLRHVIFQMTMFENEFIHLRRNGIEGAKILIVQRMLETVGVDVEQHMIARLMMVNSLRMKESLLF
ncbi:unnamed protein product [Sphagnum tenellum]